MSEEKKHSCYKPENEWCPRTVNSYPLGCSGVTLPNSMIMDPDKSWCMFCGRRIKMCEPEELT